MDELYEKICKKLGFVPSEYKSKNFGTENDTQENPFSVLSFDEKVYLYDKGYFNKN
ncbi:MAG: hypothetical protein RR446_05860 [Lachnospiraceae bacterium]